MDNSDTSLSNEISTMPSPSTKKASVIRVAQSMDDNDTTIDFLPDKKEGSQDLSNFEIPEPLSAPNSPTTKPKQSVASVVYRQHWSNISGSSNTLPFSPASSYAGGSSPNKYPRRHNRGSLFDRSTERTEDLLESAARTLQKIYRGYSGRKAYQGKINIKRKRNFKTDDLKSIWFLQISKIFYLFPQYKYKIKKELTFINSFSSSFYLIHHLVFLSSFFPPAQRMQEYILAKNPLTTLFCFLLFLFILILTCVFETENVQYYLAHQLNDWIVEEEFTPQQASIKKNFMDVESEEELWQYLQGKR